MKSNLSNGSLHDRESEIARATKTHVYGAIPIEETPINPLETLSIDYSIEGGDSARLHKRWSVLEKLERRYYCRIRSCRDCLHIINSRCLLATIMLGVCVGLGIIFLKTVLSTSSEYMGSNHYDFIIVGAGPAGSVITSKLVNHGAKVLLLEAGGATQTSLGGTDYFGGPISRFDIPLMWSGVTTCHEFHWDGFNIPGIIVAKGLGGGGINNAMLYVRALASDIEGWKMKGWTWEAILDHYLSIEDYGNDIHEDPIPSHHRVGGLVRTTRAPYIDEIAPEFMSAAIQYGLKFTTDFNDPNGRVGVGYYDFNIKGGIRDSAAREFLGPLLSDASANPNFHVELGATVKRIILRDPKSFDLGSMYSSSETIREANEDTGFTLKSLIRRLTGERYSFRRDRDDQSLDVNEKTSAGHRRFENTENDMHNAIGVEYVQDNQVKYAYLSNSVNGASNKKFELGRGIILTCGAILTPKLLMVSGIGPQDVLEKANIDVKVESPSVGKNLQDHPAVGVTFRLSPALASSYPNAYSVMSHWGTYVNLVERASRGEDIPPYEFGVLSSPGISAGAFLVSPYSENGIPDIQLTVFPTVAEPHLIQQEWTRHGKNATSSDILQQSKQMLITVALLNPEARYQIVLNNTDPLDSAPQVEKPPGHAHYLSSKDAAKLAWGVQQVILIARTRPLADLVEEILSPPESLESFDDWVHYNHYPNSHWSGSARMGVDQDSVLDENMKVRGVRGLFVGDASAFPTIPNGNVHSTILAVASQAAELIIQQATFSMP